MSLPFNRRLVISRNEAAFQVHLRCLLMDTLQGINISPLMWTAYLRTDDFPNFPRWEMFSFPGGYLFWKIPIEGWGILNRMVDVPPWMVDGRTEVVDRKQRLSVEWASWLVFLMNFAGNLSSDYFILVTSYWGYTTPEYGRFRIEATRWDGTRMHKRI